MSVKEVEKHRFDFGDGVAIESTLMDNGEATQNIFVNQELKISGGGGYTSIVLAYFQFSPENLRKLANELDQKIAKATR